MSPEEIKEIQDLLQQGMALRAIARMLGRDPKTIRRALGQKPQESQAPKLERYEAQIADFAKMDLTAPRILRELRALGYQGGLSILKARLREIRGEKKPPRKVFKRFETRPAEEAQMDWSPYRLSLGGVETIVHCFSLILCYSRRLWIGFFRNERLPTLLYAHVEALRYFQGSPMRIVYDNQTTVTLGRVGKAPIWHPRFLEFAKFTGFTAYAAKVRHKERKGKVERPFSWIESDLLRGSLFSSLAELNEKAHAWLDNVANVRKHSTTGRRVDEMYLEEKPFLIALPEIPFPTERREVRKVQKDGYLPIDGSFYPVPAYLVGQHVSVRIYPSRIEILDAAGKVAAAHVVPDQPGRIAPEGQELRGKEARLSLTVLESRFLAHFPGAEEFLVGLKLRMNALTPIHLSRIERLVGIYGEVAMRAALERAMSYRNFSALALERILERAHPNLISEPPAEPLLAGPEVMGALDDIESDSPLDYTLDSLPPTEDDSHETQS